MLWRTYEPVRTSVEGWSSHSVCELAVWGLLVYKVKLLPRYVDHLCFFEHQTPTGTRHFFGWLVWNRLDVHHNHLDHKETVTNH